MDIKETKKELSRIAVYEIVRDRLNVCEETEDKWDIFENWANEAMLFLNERINVRCEGFQEFLGENDWAKVWLVQNGFAEKVYKFEPFSIRVETKEEAAVLFHLLDTNDDVQWMIFGIRKSELSASDILVDANCCLFNKVQGEIYEENIRINPAI